MKILFSVCILFLTYENSIGQLLFKNKSSSDIKLSIGYYMETDTFKGWITEGWYTLKVNEVKCIYCKKLNARFYYYYGFNDDSLHKEYSGNTNLLVGSNPFKLVDADNESVNKKSGGKYFYRRFRKIDTEGRSIYTVTLGGKQSENEPKPQEQKTPEDSLITTPTIRVPK